MGGGYVRRWLVWVALPGVLLGATGDARAARARAVAYRDAGRAWLDNGVMRLAIDRAYGGAIVHVSAAGGRNLVNIADKGRQIQQSYYAGRSLDRRPEGQSSHWSPWAWNPVQAGNFDHDPSRVLDFAVQDHGRTLYTRCQPRLWDMDEEPAQCHFETWLRFEPGMEDVIRVTNRITCFRDRDDRWGPAVPRSQELPAVYLIRDLTRMVIYDGPAPWRNGRLTDVTYGPDDTWIWTHQHPTEPWAACVDPNTGCGVGVYSPAGGETWNMGWVGPPRGRAHDGPTMHFAPLARWSLGPDTQRSYRYWICLGTVERIRERVYALHAQIEAEP